MTTPQDPSRSDRVDRWEERVGSVRVFEHPRRKGVLYLRWRAEGNWVYLSLAKAAAAEGLATATLSDEQGQPLIGRALDRRKKWARDQAEHQLAKIRLGGGVVETPAPTPPAALTLGRTETVVFHPNTGQYPAPTRHRKEVERELAHAVRILGADLPWVLFTRSTWMQLWRTRIRELHEQMQVEQLRHDASATKAGTVHAHQKTRGGLRGAEITVSRVLAIAAWLRSQGEIPADAAVIASSWRKDLRADWLTLTAGDRLPAPARPRLTAEQFRALFAAAWDIDPRFGLMYALGAELRGGQVKRARRSDLDLPARDARHVEANEFGKFRSPGRGKKRGQEVVLTEHQRDAVDRALDPVTGYLRELEAAHQRGELADYFLFPRGVLAGGRRHRSASSQSSKNSKGSASPSTPPSLPATLPTRDRRTPAFPVASLDRYARTHVGDTAVRKWVKAAERLADIPEVKGRAWYGARRAGVDLGKKEKISREGLQELGGWSDSQVPDSIYADQQRDYAREEAAAVRARFRGESDRPSDRPRGSANDSEATSRADVESTPHNRAQTDTADAEDDGL